MKKVLFAFLFLISIAGFAQFSKTHYIPPLSNCYYLQDGINVQEAQDQYLYISCPSETKVKFKISRIGGTSITGTVSRDNPYVLAIGNGPNTQLLISKNDVGKKMNNKGFIVEAEDMVYVTVRLRATKNEKNEIVQAGGLVSKGLAALGTRFRIGAFTDTSISNNINEDDFYKGTVYTFATILATENNTKVSFSDIKTGVSLVNAPNVSNGIVLNAGESYAIAVQGATSPNLSPNLANRDGLIGTLILSDKPVAVNCGSFMGTNGVTSQRMDIGTDQIVSAERTGTEYIFIKGNGNNKVEKPLIVADSDDTEVYVNGNSSPVKILKAGEYLALDGSDFTNDGNLYVKASKSVFAYQGLGGSQDEANQNLHFVPPLRCETPKAINNIPLINKIGEDPDYLATVCIVTEAGADLTFLINGSSFTLAQLKVKYPVTGPFNVTGNTKYVTYKVQNLSGNVSVFSTRQVYVSYFGSSGSATYGGFYSGFTFNPEISFGTFDAATSSCIPNVKLSVNSISSFDSFKWYLDGKEIGGVTGNICVPAIPGFYNVVGTMTACNNISLTSDKIPVSVCAADNDNDQVNDNVDNDNDNDGIDNCTGSLGDKQIDLVNVNSGNVSKNPYNNSFTGTTKGTGNTSSFPIKGKSDGSFVTEVLAGKANSVSQKWIFDKPISLSLNYPVSAANTDWLTANGDFVLEVPTDKTITVLNPSDQLLIDTNYDGVYESGITQFSSFQVRFRLNNGGQALTPGTATFKFLAHLVKTFSITHKNLSETVNDRATFVLTATCLPMDIDNDGISNEFDSDDDNDGITDKLENFGKSKANEPFVDANGNGMNDRLEGLVLLDSDNDNVKDCWDLDSDNDGIYDLIEAGHKASDANLDGMIDGAPSAFGANGLYDALESSAESGTLNYAVTDTDNDGNSNYIELDSDADGCNDVKEAGFSDANGDGHLGNVLSVVNAFGKVTSATDGYTVPTTDNYVTSAPIIITVQPMDQSICENQSTSFAIETNGVNGYQWQMSKEGNNFVDVVDNENYSGSKEKVLKVMNVTSNMNGYKFQVKLVKNGNSCNLLSDSVTLKVLALPTVTDPVTLIQCDDDVDGTTYFNLRQIESQISVNHDNEKFDYFTTSASAKNNDNKYLISKPTVYKSSDGKVWARITNANGCFNVVQVNLVVSVTQIPAETVFKFSACDDYVDEKNDDNDGITTFDFHKATDKIKEMLPNNATYDVKYYVTQQDALQETDEQGNSLAISDVSQYRNVGYQNLQNIWVRIDSSIPNSCVGLGTYVQLIVNPLPKIEKVHENVICKGNVNQTVNLNAGLISGSRSQYEYQWYLGETKIENAQGYYYEAATDGTYFCKVTDVSTNCERTRTEKVISSEVAVIDGVQVEDLSENSKATILVSGTGKYEYALDNHYGPYQDSNVFENVEMGFHTVYVNDKNGCGMIPQNIAVVGAPNFFTPNGDGYNDLWKPKGISSEFNKKTVVYIFDRFGKLLSQIANGESDGWDGTFNGNPMPSDDYWYVIKMEDGREAKGHFSLKR